MEDGKKKRIVYMVILSALLLLIILGFFYGRSGQGKDGSRLDGRNRDSVSEKENEASSGGAQGVDAQTAEGTAAIEESRLLGGGSGEVIFEIETMERQYQADDGAVIFEASLSWPALKGEGMAVQKVNEYFQLWAAKKLRGQQQYGGDRIKAAGI